MANRKLRLFRHYRYSNRTHALVNLEAILSSQHIEETVAPAATFPPMVINVSPRVVPLATASSITILGSGFTNEMDLYLIPREGSVGTTVAIPKTEEAGLKVAFTFVNYSKVVLNMQFDEFVKLDVCCVNNLGTSVWTTSIGNNEVYLLAGEVVPEVAPLQVSNVLEYPESNGVLTNTLRCTAGFEPLALDLGYLDDSVEGVLTNTLRCTAGFLPLGLVTISATEGQDGMVDDNVLTNEIRCTVGFEPLEYKSDALADDNVLTNTLRCTAGFTDLTII